MFPWLRQPNTSLTESRRKAKIDKHLEMKDSIQEEVGVIMSIETMSREEHKKKLAEDANLKTFAVKVSEEIPEDVILESVKILFVEEGQRKTVEEATMVDVDGKPVPKEVIIESIQA